MKVIQKMVNKIYYIILIYIAFTTNKISIDLEQNKTLNLNILLLLLVVEKNNKLFVQVKMCFC